MSCVTGYWFTITLSYEGAVYSFGKNDNGQLGLGSGDDDWVVTVPSVIPRLPKIKLISCGPSFTVCVDYDGNVWSFGKNNFGQLGTGNLTDSDVPVKIQHLPPVQSVSCGESHTLFITNDSDLWGTGNNRYGQLCLGKESSQFTPQKTRYCNISKINAGSSYSFFQTNQGVIYGCGHNCYGQLGLGHLEHPQFEPCIISDKCVNIFERCIAPVQPPNIVEFCCGFFHSLFLDSEGKVYSVGKNNLGSLGLGHNLDVNVMNQIPGIPPIHTITCSGSSSYLLDFDGNIWSFGENSGAQLGHGHRDNLNIPTMVSSLKNIKDISRGPFGHHFLAKDSKNSIFVVGLNNFKQLGTQNVAKIVSSPEKMDSNFSQIWGDSFAHSNAKSARK